MDWKDGKINMDSDLRIFPKISSRSVTCFLKTTWKAVFEISEGPEPWEEELARLSEMDSGNDLTTKSWAPMNPFCKMG